MSMCIHIRTFIYIDDYGGTCDAIATPRFAHARAKSGLTHSAYIYMHVRMRICVYIDMFVYILMRINLTCDDIATPRFAYTRPKSGLIRSAHIYARTYTCMCR